MRAELTWPRSGPDDRNREAAGVPNDLIQGAALDAAHHEEVETFRLTHREAGDDVRMIQMRDGDRFPLEALDHPLAHQQAGRHDLDGDLAIEGDVVRQKHGGHPAPSQLAADLELAARGAPEPGYDFSPGRIVFGQLAGNRVRVRPGDAWSAALGAGLVGLQKELATARAPQQLRSALGAEAVIRPERASALKTGNRRGHAAAGRHPVGEDGSILKAVR